MLLRPSKPSFDADHPVVLEKPRQGWMPGSPISKPTDSTAHHTAPSQAATGVEPAALAVND